MFVNQYKNKFVEISSKNNALSLYQNLKLNINYFKNLGLIRSYFATFLNNGLYIPGL